MLVNLRGVANLLRHNSGIQGVPKRPHENCTAISHWIPRWEYNKTAQGSVPVRSIVYGEKSLKVKQVSDAHPQFFFVKCLSQMLMKISYFLDYIVLKAFSKLR